MSHTDDVLNHIDRSINLNDTCSHLQSALDTEAKLTFGHLSPGRLSPNLFLNLNLDNIGERKAIDIDWTTYTDSVPTTSCTISLPNAHPHPELCMASPSATTVPYAMAHVNPYGRSSTSMDMSNYLNLDTAATCTAYDDIKYIGVDHFSNLDGFKSDCMFGMGDGVCLSDRDIEVADVLVKEAGADLHDMHDTFEMHESMEKSMPLLDVNVDGSSFTVHSEH